jgi:hypothetical protein
MRNNLVRPSDKILLRGPELAIEREQARRAALLTERKASTTVRPEKRDGLVRRQPR